MAGKIPHSSWKKFALFTALLLITNFITIVAQEDKSFLNQDDFEIKLKEAIEKNDESLLISIVQSNRLKTKPFVLSLTDKSLDSELNGDKADAKQMLGDAEKVARTFERLFGEKSLINIVNEYNELSLAEKIEKFRADSLNKLATSYRRDRERDDEALQLYNEALSIYRNINDTYGKAIVYGGMGYIYFFYIS